MGQATARTLLQRAGTHPNDIIASLHHRGGDALRKIEARHATARPTNHLRHMTKEKETSMGNTLDNKKRRDTQARRDRIRERLLRGPIETMEALELIGPAFYDNYRIAKIFRASLREGEELYIEKLAPKRRLYGLDPEKLRDMAEAILEYVERQSRLRKDREHAATRPASTSVAARTRS